MTNTNTDRDTAIPPYIDERGHVIIGDTRWGRWTINASCGFGIGLSSWPGPSNTATNAGPKALLSEILDHADDDDADLAGLVRILADTGAGATTDPAAARNMIGAFVARRFIDTMNHGDPQ